MRCREKIILMLLYVFCVFNPGYVVADKVPRRDNSTLHILDIKTNSLGMKFVLIPPGTFIMGSPRDELGHDYTEEQHKVTITKGFYLQTTEVTQGQWERVMGCNPSFFLNCGKDCPVENVSFYDVQKFIEKLNKIEEKRNRRYRLPTEAEWEYACRAGINTPFNNGGTITEKDSFYNKFLDKVGWYYGNSKEGTHPVAQKAPNRWGLYDMHGNVWEWTQDWYAKYPFGYSVDKGGPPSGCSKVRRGGSWRESPFFCRAAYRSSCRPEVRDPDMGFRLVMEILPPKSRKNPCEALQITKKTFNVGKPEKYLLQREDILFDFGSYELRQDMKSVLDKIVDVVKNKDVEIHLIGHTCDIGTCDYNLDLSKNRVEAVKDYLLKKGVSACEIFVSYYGETQPRFPNTSERTRRLNREVEVKVFGIKSRANSKKQLKDNACCKEKQDVETQQVSENTLIPPVTPEIPIQGTRMESGGGEKIHKGILINQEEIAKLPTWGPAWEALKRYADKPLDLPDLSDLKKRENIKVLAKALVYARTHDELYRQQVIDAIMFAMGTENRANTLSVGVKLVSYIIAADLVGLPMDKEKKFVEWLKKVQNMKFSDGRTISECHEIRPNNWGTNAGATREAIDIYLNDKKDLERAAMVFKGWLGDRSVYSGFKFGDLSWQANPFRPVGINPRGATKYGHIIDGVLPDDQRRSGPFRWPPPKEGYVYAALQGAVAQAIILYRAGYKDVWNWGDRALLRAFKWLYEVADYPPQGDDTWLPYVINFYYNTNFPAPIPSRPGKNIGFTDWIYGIYRSKRP
ncbi:MAG: SUMF1/EgtB/PvdO family nonheme iron enzyme [Desulfonauticus sp.]|nr:SUMF1/EgtB/PvdO family nonheme iron enzyme [Desulfonauticus sp.]